MIMATDEEVEKFVAENRELIERMMSVQKDNLEKTAEVGKEFTMLAMESTFVAAEIVRQKSEKFVKDTYNTITNPVVQKHFMTAGMEFLYGLSTIVETAPMPSKVREGAKDLERNLRSAACKSNEGCPAKVNKVEIPAQEEPAAE
jgi:hypothetical protein